MTPRPFRRRVGAIALVFVLVPAPAAPTAAAKGRPDLGTLVISCWHGGALSSEARIFVDGFEIGPGPCATLQVRAKEGHDVRAGVFLGNDRYLAFEDADVRVAKDGVRMLDAELRPATAAEAPALSFALAVRRGAEWRGDAGAVAPDGSRIARGAETNSVLLFDQDLRPLGRLGDEGEYWVSFVTALAFSDDGRRLASTGYVWKSSTRTITVWDTAQWAVVATYTVPYEGAEAVALDGSGGAVAAGFSTGSVRLWSVEEGRLRWQSPPMQQNPIDRLFFVDGGRALVTDAGEFTATVFLDAATGRELATVEGRLLGVLADGRVVTRVFDEEVRETQGRLKFWDPHTARLLGTNGCGRWPSIFCPTWPVCIDTGAGRTEVWNWETGERLWAVPANASGITRDGRRLVTAVGIFELPPIPPAALDRSRPSG